MIYCAGKCESFSFAKSIGVGLVESAINLTLSIMHDKPSEIVFIGTCGAYNVESQLLEIIESTSAANIELSFLQNQSYTPLDNFVNVSYETMGENLDKDTSKNKNVSHETFNLENAKSQNIINSSNYISTDSGLADRLLKLGILYENMEFFSILQVAKAFNIPALGIFCITNHIHKDAQKEFLENHNAAKQKLESYIKSKF
ncbi:MAG: purine-nucleoside phosphorylase [Helicobacter sp.]|nr:purine-nucleoside phosphorylase [Helicobacteraceae bacterium]MDY3114044.1 purine-nucleoside phosphorylase [Helicobacter sp.]